MDYSEKVEAYYGQEHPFKEGIQILRELALKANAAETFKWQAPVYGINGKNVFSFRNWFLQRRFFDRSQKCISQRAKREDFGHAPLAFQVSGRC